MRVGLVTTSYPRFPGDPAGSFVAEHAAFLARAGHDVEVIAAGSGGPSGSVRVTWVAARPGLFDRGGAPEALAGGGAPLAGGAARLAGGAARLAAAGRAWLAAAPFSLALVHTVARRAPAWDAAVAHWIVPSALAAMIAAPRLPLLAIAHSGDVHLLRRLRAIRPMGALCARRGARLSFVTDELRRLFLAGAPGCAGSSQVCPMGVDVARLRAARRVRPAAAGEPPTVLFLGRLVPVKGVDILVRAAAAWRSGARLVIAGAGPAERELRRLAAAAPPGRVVFAGQLQGRDRDAALARADVVALPSVRVEGGRSEGLPVVALESMAAGAALVASDLGGLAELPAAAVTRVAPGDPAVLADAIDRLIADGERRLAQVEAQDRVVDAFDWSAVGPRLIPPRASPRLCVVAH